MTTSNSSESEQKVSRKKEKARAIATAPLEEKAPKPPAEAPPVYESLDENDFPIASRLRLRERERTEYVIGYVLQRGPKGQIIKQIPVSYDMGNGKKETKLETWYYQTIQDLTDLYGGGEIVFICKDHQNRTMGNVHLELPGELRIDPALMQMAEEPTHPQDPISMGAGTLVDLSGPMIMPHGLSKEMQFMWIQSQQMQRQREKDHERELKDKDTMYQFLLKSVQDSFDRSLREIDARLGYIVQLHKEQVTIVTKYSDSDMERVRIFANLQMEILTSMFEQLLKANPQTGETSSAKMLAERDKQIFDLQKKMFEFKFDLMVSQIKKPKTKEDWITQLKEMDIMGGLEKATGLFERLARVDSISKFKEEFAQWMMEKMKETQEASGAQDAAAAASNETVSGTVVNNNPHANDPLGPT